MPPRPCPPLFELRLPAGSDRLIHLPAGTLLLVRDGPLQLGLPVQWLAATVVSPQRHLREGETHRLVSAGMVRLLAPVGATLQCQLPESLARRLGQHGQALAGHWADWVRRRGWV